MAATLDEITWSEPILPARADRAWEAEVKRRGGRFSEVDRRILASPWVREAGFRIKTYRPVELPQRLYLICLMVAAQENSCRYCYGANRAYMRILGYSEDFLGRLERDVQMAELEEKERFCIRFFRDLARSRPRPSRDVRDVLIGLGYSPLAVSEMAFAVASCCLYNRLSTLIAAPPELAFERLANSPLGWIAGLAAPLVQALQRAGQRAPQSSAISEEVVANGKFGPVLAPLAGLPAQEVMASMIEGAFGSDVLNTATKAMMFAVIARTLSSPLCEAEARKILATEGLGVAEIESSLSTLQWQGLSQEQAGLLAWARDTVHYDTGTIQPMTRQLGASIGDSALLDAIGVAALANATVRLAMLIE